MQNYLESSASKKWQGIFTQYKQKLNQRAHITTLDITLLLKQFSTLISAGIPIIQSLEMLEISQEKIKLRLLIYAIKKDILTGKPFHHSLEQYPAYFDKLTCHLIRTGEHTGKLDSVLNTVAAYQEKNRLLHYRIKQALFYPCTITLTALFVTICLFLFVIPRFADLFQDFNQALPTMTLWIFYASHLLQQYSRYLLIFTICMISIIFHNQKTLKSSLLSILSSLPVIKALLKKTLLARFARNLAMTFAAGIPITEALGLSSSLSNDLEFTHILTEVRYQITAGLQLHHVMKMFPYFPLLMIQMVKIGEETGMLEQMLDKMADFIEADIDQLIHHASKLLEPLIMIVLGVLIGGLIIGMYLPIFKLGTTL